MKRTLNETLNAVNLMNGYDPSTRFNVADEVIITKRVLSWTEGQNYRSYRVSRTREVLLEVT